jgi:major membrane immunogen (membrane-anchored lipoprotein)
MKKLLAITVLALGLLTVSCSTDDSNILTTDTNITLTHTEFEKTISYKGKNYSFYNSGKVVIDTTEYQNTHHLKRTTTIDGQIVSAYRFIRVMTDNGKVEFFVDEKILENNNSIIVNVY